MTTIKRLTQVLVLPFGIGQLSSIAPHVEGGLLEVGPLLRLAEVGLAEFFRLRDLCVLQGANSGLRPTQLSSLGTHLW